MVTKRLISFNSLEQQIEVFNISKQLYDGLFSSKNEVAFEILW